MMRQGIYVLRFQFAAPQKTYDKYLFSSECPAGLVGGVEYYYNHSSSHRNRKVIVEANGRTSEPSNAALRI